MLRAAPRLRGMVGYGVIGSPADSGSVSLGSSPGTPAKLLQRAGSVVPNRIAAPLCSGLARRPLKAVARVRIPSGLQTRNPRSTAGVFFIYMTARTSATSQLMRQTLGCMQLRRATNVRGYQASAMMLGEVSELNIARVQMAPLSLGYPAKC